jgi:hypothetical protein
MQGATPKNSVECGGAARGGKVQVPRSESSGLSVEMYIWWWRQGKMRGRGADRVETRPR